ncbi:MAG: hypothetical protein IJY96_03710 [Oscillospiraceae bacterium]|nr:hypothetical protein [Oscillospiraceae bacterium]
MNKTDFAALAAFLKESEGGHRAAAAALAADSRGDEAAFEKIRANVFGIFAAVLETAVKLHGESDTAFGFFAKKLREIPSSWRANLAAAGEKGDSEAALREKLKLESVAEIEKWLKEAE